MDTTIAAICTPPGDGGIGIIRISGDQALPGFRKLFSTKDSKGLTNRHLTYGKIVDPVTGNMVDEVLAVFMEGPHTYTTEDVVEIHCHGGMVPLRRLLSLVFHQGIQMAAPGEFTKRAFLGGRLDLSQAEAVIDIIQARTDAACDLALAHLQGRFSETIGQLRCQLTDVMVHLSVNIDYPDEDIEEVERDQLVVDLHKIQSQIQQLASDAKQGKLLRDGVQVSIIGRPNVGKSSLMNLLLREARAIVTDIPGTTRDTIQETLSIGGIPVQLTDTAGIRQTEDVIEQIGIQRSREAMLHADLVLLLLDNSRPLEEEDHQLLNMVDPRRTLILFNKADQPPAFTSEEQKGLAGDCPYLVTSFLATGQGSAATAIETAIETLLLGGKLHSDGRGVAMGARQEEALWQAATAIAAAVQAAEKGLPLELLEIDVAETYAALGLITGDSVQDDVIDQVFSRFCLGK